MRAVRKQSKILNATLQHGNDMEASSRQLKFMQFAYTVEVDLTLKEKQMSEMKNHASNPPKKIVVESDDEVEIVKEPSSEESKKMNSLGVQKTPTFTENWASDGESDFDAIEDELQNNEDPPVNVDNDEHHTNESNDADVYLHDFSLVISTSFSNIGYGTRNLLLNSLPPLLSEGSLNRGLVRILPHVLFIYFGLLSCILCWNTLNFGGVFSNALENSLKLRHRLLDQA